MRLFVSLALVGCTAEYRVLLDGEPVDGLTGAAEAAVPGSVIELEAIRYDGGIQLPDDVTIVGNGATIHGATGRLIESVGTLTLRDLTLVGGSDDEGSAVRAEDLVLERVSIRDGAGEVSVWVDASIDASDTNIEHAGIAVWATSALGRARTVSLARFWTDGDLQVEADRAVLTDVEALQIRTGGLNTRLQNTASAILAVRGRVAQVFGAEASLGATLDVDDLLLTGTGGGAWTITGETVSGVGIQGTLVSITAAQLILNEVTGDDLQLVGTERAELATLSAPRITAFGEQLFIDDLQANDLTMVGLGTQRDLRITGVNPKLSAALGLLEGVIVHADSGQADVELSAASATNLLVVEPANAGAAVGIRSPNYANVHQSTLLFGDRTSLTSPDSVVYFEDSVIHGHALGDIVGRNTWEDTVAFSDTEALPPRLGLWIEDPLFLAPGNPELNPLSDWTAAGAFAGPGGPALLARWRSLSQ